ncbi:hypothetical protein QR680_009831 [Steinernema hermaphroditum]|uniref:Uncharacterized protein n=1 Tax=Steinernema hermaphroditum TaxID=289476 RepID=A0AA39M9L2_9BILA|nr:hypothetical protein QR680_009831 [Steinernema hermaphroditum]
MSRDSSREEYTFEDRGIDIPEEDPGQQSMLSPTGSTDTGHGGSPTSMAHTVTETDAFSDSDTVHLHEIVTQMTAERDHFSKKVEQLRARVEQYESTIEAYERKDEEKDDTIEKQRKMIEDLQNKNENLQRKNEDLHRTNIYIEEHRDEVHKVFGECGSSDLFRFRTTLPVTRALTKRPHHSVPPTEG